MKNISFKLDDDLHKKIKIKATTEGKTIKDYLISLALKDINLQKEGEKSENIR